MIPRYSRPEMVAIWSPETRFRIWFEIEAHACDALAEIGVIPKEAARTIWEKGNAATFDVDKIDDDRARHQARRHRLPDASRRIRRARRPLHPPGHDLVRRARHLPGRPAGARQRHPARRSRRPARGAEEARLRAQGYGHDRPQPRHPCRTDDLRHQDGAGLCRIHARPRTACARPRGHRDLRDLGRRRHLRQHRPLVEEHVAAKLGLKPEPVSTQVIPRDRHAMYLCNARRDRLVRRAPRDRDPPPAAHGSAGSRGVFLAGPEGLVGDAAQAQPGADRKPDRPCPHGPLLRDAGDGERGALARARYLAFVGRTHDRSGRHHHARLRAARA